MDSDTDSDEESTLQDIQIMTSVLEEDEPSTSGHSSITSSRAGTIQGSQESQELTQLQSALALNKLMNEKFGRLEKILIGRLQECRERLSKFKNKQCPSKLDKNSLFRYISCGKPYFKDRTLFPAPDNEDTVLMAKSGMYDFSTVTTVPGWTIKDKTDFAALLLKMSKDLKKEDLIAKIANLRRAVKGKKFNPELEEKVSAIKKEIEGLNKKTLKELAWPIDQDYDWDTVAHTLAYRHSAHEYRSLWRLFLHPDINKSNWSRIEHLTLKRIAHSHSLHDWEAIAKELDSGRTGYQCFVYFRTNMTNTFTSQKWTKEEEEYLKRLIEYFREEHYIPWGQVAGAIENRTKIQIYNKYARLLEERKGRFLPEEDAVLLTCLDEIGPSFKRIAKYLPGRSSTQLRARYHVLSKRTRISMVWTVAEDRKLVQMMANQDSATNYSSMTVHFPGKSRVNLRARYITLVKWMRKHPNLDISRAPRRGARRLSHGQASENLNKAVENLKERIQSEVEMKKKKQRINKDSPEHIIEDAIIVTLINEQIKLDEFKKSVLYDDELLLDQLSERYNDHSQAKQSVNVKNLQKILILLKSKLNKTNFSASYYNEMYPGLEQEDQETCTVRVKSYSKKNMIKTIHLDSVPDIWGHNILGTSEYVFPPNYSTITGCRKLMAYVSTHTSDESRPNLGTLARKNDLLKDQLSSFMDRFTALFMWPMLLSNEVPKVKDKIQRNFRAARVYLPGDPSGVAIPINTVNEIHERIDLDESYEKEDIVVEDLVGNEMSW